MNILVITPIYPAKFNPKGTTPLVHYFTRQWVKLGHNVLVIHIVPQYPRLFYFVAKLFDKFIVSKLGIIIPTTSPIEYEDNNEGVFVKHIVENKYIPHGRFSKTNISKIIQKIFAITTDFSPNIVVGHWANPTLEIISSLKNILKVPSGIVFHETGEQIMHYYGNDSTSLLNNVDYIGYRSYPLKRDFENLFGVHKSFMAFSGVPVSFLNESYRYSGKDFDTVNKFIFVGTLMERKYPAEILYSLDKSFKDHSFFMTYIGEGKESEKIQDFAQNNNLLHNIQLTGRIPREQIVQYLRESQVFVMISKNEVFGLVYLEAMALGCITIASRNEGFDGIIVDGVNGFLCDAGNVEELSKIIDGIRFLPKEKLIEMSNNAINTARLFSDEKVAADYLNIFMQHDK